MENKSEYSDREKRIRELYDLGMAADKEGRGDIAFEHFNEALGLAKAENQELHVSNFLNLIGILYKRWGKYEEAIENYRESLQIFEESGDIKNKCATLMLIGGIYEDWGKYKEAIEYYKQSSKAYKEFDNKEIKTNGISINLCCIGNVYWSWGRYEEALECYQQSLQLYDEIGEVESKSMPLCGFGLVYKMQGRYKKALNNYEQALQIDKQFNNVNSQGILLMNIGEIYLAWGKLKEALRYYRQAKQIFIDLEDKLNLGWILNNIGEVYQIQGDYEEAINYFQQSLQIFEKIGFVKGKSWVLDNFGKVYYESGTYEDAFKNFQQALQLRDEIGDIKGKGETLNNIGKLERKNKNLSKALYYHKKGLEMAEKLDGIHDIAIYTKEIATDYKDMDKYKKALENFETSLSNYREIFVKTPIEYQKAFESEFEELYDIIAELDEIIDKSDEVISPSITDNIRKIVQLLEKSDIEGLKVNIEDIKSKLDSWTKDKEVTPVSTADISIKKEIIVFMSYVTKDAEAFKIKEIANSLDKYERIKKVLYWERDTEDNIQKYMSDNLGACDVLLLFCSPNTLVSKPVGDEWTAANAMGKPIIPVFTDDNDIPPLLTPKMGVKYNIFDLQKNIAKIYELIIRKTEKRIVDVKDLKTI